jgi:hypothetical protein
VALQYSACCVKAGASINIIACGQSLSRRVTHLYSADIATITVFITECSMQHLQLVVFACDSTVSVGCIVLAAAMLRQ